MTDLSPAAQSVLDAVFDHWPGGYNRLGKLRCVAAALRAVADQVVSPIPDDCTADVFNRQLDIRAKLLAIAAELDGHG